MLVSLRDAMRRREIWVVGANRWRNPEDDLPADFEGNRDVHYAALGQPQDASEFITALQNKLRASLDRFEQALAGGATGGVAIVKEHGEPWIRVSPRGKQDEPESLVAIKAEIERRWGTIDLLDILKYAEFDTGLHRRVHLGRHPREPVQGRGHEQPPGAGPGHHGQCGSRSAPPRE
ncbi:MULTISPECIES: hypothetical protein [unclassified Streptomyces]|uniref:hypothetical protein n=1 Tax=Streptomyces sp. NPDC127129 TaxID=3345373 RepID=UPI0036256BFB